MQPAMATARKQKGVPSEMDSTPLDTWCGLDPVVLGLAPPCSDEDLGGWAVRSLTVFMGTCRVLSYGFNSSQTHMETPSVRRNSMDVPDKLKSCFRTRLY